MCSVVGLVCVFALVVCWGVLAVCGRGRLTCLFEHSIVPECKSVC